MHGTTRRGNRSRENRRSEEIEGDLFASAPVVPVIPASSCLSSIWSGCWRRRRRGRAYSRRHLEVVDVIGRRRGRRNGSRRNAGSGWLRRLHLRGSGSRRSGRPIVFNLHVVISHGHLWVTIGTIPVIPRIARSAPSAPRRCHLSASPMGVVP